MSRCDGDVHLPVADGCPSVVDDLDLEPVRRRQRLRHVDRTVQRVLAVTDESKVWHAITGELRSVVGDVLEERRVDCHAWLGRNLEATVLVGRRGIDRSCPRHAEHDRPVGRR